MYRRIAILSILISLVISISVNVGSIDKREDEYIEVEVRGEVIEEKIVRLKSGSTFEDVLQEIELNVNADISSISLSSALYNNQIIVIPEKKEYGLISINSAELEELMTLSGIGEKTAMKIIEYRETNGSFATLEELMNVKGIGTAKFEKIKEHISL